jgi:hypothetical protein
VLTVPLQWQQWLVEVQVCTKPHYPQGSSSMEESVEGRVCCPQTIPLQGHQSLRKEGNCSIPFAVRALFSL